VAEDSVAPGAMLASSIEAAIKKCDLMILVWSRNAAASDWVKQEVGAAKSAEKRILPLMLESGLDLPPMIADLKYLDITKHPNDWLLYIQNSLQTMAAAQQQSTVPPRKSAAKPQTMIMMQGSATIQIQITKEEALLIGALLVVIILLASQAKGSAGGQYLDRPNYLRTPGRGLHPTLDSVGSRPHRVVLSESWPHLLVLPPFENSTNSNSAISLSMSSLRLLVTCFE